ncbi:MAG: hypothetical protein CME38_18885 [Haliea sp.]|nr:hypothetical protein [Haliea sp.]
MPSRITARFFRVRESVDCEFTFRDALRAVAQLPVANRRRALADDYEMRLERLTELEDGRLIGDFTRILKDDFPAVIEHDQLSELAADELGACCAFLFDPALSLLVFQYDVRKVSPNRALGYLLEFHRGYSFYPEPVANTDAWAKFDTGSVRKLRVRVAAPEDMEFVGNTELGNSVRSLAGAYEAPSILIEVSMGHHKGSLGARIKQAVRELVGNQDVRLLDVKTAEETSEFSLLNDLMEHREFFDIPAEPTASYHAREQFVMRAHDEKKRILRGMFNEVR